MTNMDEEKRFDILAVALEREGYEVVVNFGHADGKERYRYGHLRGRSVNGFFAPTNQHSARYCSGRLCADHVDCYDKPSKCPLVIRLPKSDREAMEIVRWLGKLGSREGYQVSNSYDYLDNNPFPYQMED